MCKIDIPYDINNDILSLINSYEKNSYKCLKEGVII